METDAVADPISERPKGSTSRRSSFKTLLQNISKSLQLRDLRGLKFLCMGDGRYLIPMGKMEKIRSAVNIFDELESMSLISSNDVTILCELLHHIGRNDLLSYFKCTPASVTEKIRARGPLVNSYRLMLYKLCEELTTDIISDLSYLCSDSLSSTERESITTPEDFITLLEKKRLISSTDLTYLVEMLEDINKPRLVAKINDFQLLDKNEIYEQQALAAHVGRQSYDDKELEQQNLDPTEQFPYLSKRAQPLDPHSTVNNVSSTRTAAAAVMTDAPLTPPFTAAVSLGGNGEGTMGSTSQLVTTIGQSSESSGPREMGCARNTSIVDLATDVVLSDEDLPSYPMTRRPRGLCVIISNKVFYRDPNNPSDILSHRTGTAVDEDNLTKLFKERLNFETKIHSNLSDTEMVSLLEEKAKINHTNYDCFVCCILSHGTVGAVYGVNGVLVEIRKLMGIFKKKLCPTLQDKPKLFFLEASEEVKAEPEDLAADGDDPIPAIPSQPDFLLCYSTVPGNVSHRSDTRGSWYIDSLVRNMTHHVDSHDLMSILIAVNRDVSEQKARRSDGLSYQSPAPIATLRKRLYFR